MKNPRRFWITNEDVEKYINESLKKSDDFLIQLEEYAIKNNVPIMTKDTKNLIEVIGNILKPKKILEIGTAIGYSAICFSKFLEKSGTIETIEIDFNIAAIAKENIKICIK